MSERPANPTVIEQQDETVEIEGDAELVTWYKLYFDYDMGLPQEYTFALPWTDDVSKSYRIRFTYNYANKNYFLVVYVWDITDGTNDLIFVRKVLQDIIYKIGYFRLLIYELNITEKYLTTVNDSEFKLTGVISQL